MSIRLASVVAHVRVNAVAWAMGMGGCVYSHDCTSCMVCKHVHVYFGVKHTVLISVKKILSLALNNARAQNNGQFWMLTNIYAQGGITGFYSCYSKYNTKRAYHIRRCTSRPIHNASNAAISDQRPVARPEPAKAVDSQCTRLGNQLPSTTMVTTLRCGGKKIAFN